MVTGSLEKDADEFDDSNGDLLVDLDDERVLNVDKFRHNKNDQQD